MLPASRGVATAEDSPTRRGRKIGGDDEPVGAQRSDGLHPRSRFNHAAVEEQERRAVTFFRPSHIHVSLAPGDSDETSLDGIFRNEIIAGDLALSPEQASPALNLPGEGGGSPGSGSEKSDGSTAVHGFPFKTR